MENAFLLRLLSEKSEEGLKLVIREYAPVAKAIAGRVLRNRPEDAEECVADVFLSLWKNAGTLSAQNTPLKGWIVVASRNAAINRYHQLKRRNELSLNDEVAPELLSFDVLEHDFEGLQALLGSMGETDREIFIRKYYFLESAAEIAGRLKMTEDSVNKRLSRGRKQLKLQFMEEMCV